MERGAQPAARPAAAREGPPPPAVRRQTRACASSAGGASAPASTRGGASSRARSMAAGRQSRWWSRARVAPRSTASATAWCPLAPRHLGRCPTMERWVGRHALRSVVRAARYQHSAVRRPQLSPPPSFARLPSQPSTHTDHGALPGAQGRGPAAAAIRRGALPQRHARGAVADCRPAGRRWARAAAAAEAGGQGAPLPNPHFVSTHARLPCRYSHTVVPGLVVSQTSHPPDIPSTAPP
jgi:hypothetical protein